MPPKRLPTKWEFRRATRHSNVLKIRGTIRAIDEALAEWHKRAPTLPNTIGVYKECRHWLKAKAGKNTEVANKRRAEIVQLVNRSLLWLHHLDPRLGEMLLRFNAKKGAPAPFASTQLSGVYQHERSLYMSGGKQRAPSGSLLDAHFQQAQQQQPGTFGGKEFGDLTEMEYAELDRHFQQQYSVIYLKKLDRLRDMVYVENQSLIGFDGTPFSTQGQAGWPYAIDEHGNLFSQDDRAAPGQFNHSSFNAGKDVICAGFIRANVGVLQSISNNSGHYKPTQQNLWNAVQMLTQEIGPAGVAGAKAEYWDFAEEPGWIHIYEFPFGAFPAAGHVGGVHQIRLPAV